jgi:hypothetical protein
MLLSDGVKLMMVQNTNVSSLLDVVEVGQVSAREMHMGGHRAPKSS